MAKIKITDNSTTRKIVSPTQVQMDDWLVAELAEAGQDKMLEDESPSTIFKFESDESID